MPGWQVNWTLCLLESFLSLWTLTLRFLVQNHCPFKEISCGYSKNVFYFQIASERRAKLKCNLVPCILQKGSHVFPTRIVSF